jgi:hypothetical protein
VTIKKSYGALISFILFFALGINCCYAELSVGDPYGGGTVFCVSKTPDTEQCVPRGSGNYGLIMANERGRTSWSSECLKVNVALSVDNGFANTASIINALPQDNPNNNAAWLSHNYIYTCSSDGSQYYGIPPVEYIVTGWYLPSKNELNKMYLYVKENPMGENCFGNSNRQGIDAKCLVAECDNQYQYWSSSESCKSCAFSQNFENGQCTCEEKKKPYYVCPIRAFYYNTFQHINRLSTNRHEQILQRLQQIDGVIVVLQQQQAALLELPRLCEQVHEVVAQVNRQTTAKVEELGKELRQQLNSTATTQQLQEAHGKLIRIEELMQRLNVNPDAGNEPSILWYFCPFLKEGGVCINQIPDCCVTFLASMVIWALGVSVVSAYWNYSC